MRLLAFLIFVPLQIMWLPLSVLGSVMVAYRQLAVSKRLGVSQTAVEIINGRWTMDVFGMRDDEAARKLARAIPNTSVPGLWLSLFPLWIATKVARQPFLYPTLPVPQKAGIASLVPSRTVVFDDLIAANADACDQLVILGAGLDTRAYGALKSSGLAIFEVDEAANQANKRASLAAAHIDADHVHFVVADFAQREWIASLLASDFDPKKRTIFLWEGVTLYLSEGAVTHTLRVLKENAARASVVLTDIYAHRVLKLTKGKALSWSLELTGEQTQFGLDFSTDFAARLGDFAEANGTTLRSRQFLGESGKEGPFVAIAELVL